jgi:hypothetical protein
VAALAARLGPEERTRLAESAVRELVDALALTPRWADASDLAGEVAKLNPQLGPEEGARQATAAARQLLDALAKSRGSAQWGIGAHAVVALGTRLGVEEARAVAGMTLKCLPKTTEAHEVLLLAQAIVAVLPRLGPDEAGAATRRLLDVLAYDSDPSDLAKLTQIMETLLVNLPPEATSQRVCLLATAIGSSPMAPAPFPGLSPLCEAARPLPGRFTEPQLVDLLKMPTCQWQMREVIVRQLGHQCGRPFANQWEFVAWVRQHRPDLDLTSPPVRPSQP